MTLKWDYEKRTVECSMPGYVQEALLKFQHHYEGSRHSSPSPHVPIQYGQKMQMANIDDSDPLTKRKSNYYNKFVASSYTMQEQLMQQCYMP